MLRLAVLISGGGTNLQSLIDGAASDPEAGYEIKAVISDRKADGLARAVRAGIDIWELNRKEGSAILADKLMNILSNRVDLIVLAGFLSILDQSFIEAWEGRIINIHPALLPDFGGKGMYGINVHKAVIASGVTKSGCTVHQVDTGIDTGRIIGQMSLDVDASWNAERLQREVLKLEHRLLPRTVKSIACKEIIL